MIDNGTQFAASIYDDLTGLYNRRYFLDEIKRQDIDKQCPVSIIIGDINGLQLINDKFGYQTGDNTIIRTVEILKECCRKEDIIARTGEDEFSVILPETDEKKTQRICRRIYERCEQLDKGKTQDISSISISIGHHTCANFTDSMIDITKEAEKRMARHKMIETKSKRRPVVSSVISILYEKYEGTEEHINVMKLLCRKTGAALDLSDSMLDELLLVSELHDIGKIAISDAIINKNAKLTKEEKRQVQNHSESGYRIAQSIPEFQHISEYILSHHEKWDGTGYPRKLKEEEIPVISRIIAIVSAYDAMTMKRPYRDALPEEYAINEIRTCSGTQFDPKIAKAFIEKVLGEKWQS